MIKKRAYYVSERYNRRTVFGRIQANRHIVLTIRQCAIYSKHQTNVSGKFRHTGIYPKFVNIMEITQLKPHNWRSFSYFIV
jgi:hypothetical protein